MENYFDYIRWRGDLLFSQDPLNEVDACILCVISYLDWKDIVPSLLERKTVSLRDAAFLYQEKWKHQSENNSPIVEFTEEQQALLSEISRAPRFSDIQIGGYLVRREYEESQQFAGITYFPGDMGNETPDFVVCYRGTDNSVIGWREDFQLLYSVQVPSQESAREYLTQVMQVFPGTCVVAGHSKGGNLAVYAAHQICEANEARLLQIYNFDGPGFELAEFPDFSHPVEEKILNILPKETVVGALLPLIGKKRIVDAVKIGAHQHIPSTWTVEGCRFVDGQRGESSILAQEIVEKWRDEVSLEDRESLVTVVFDMIDKGEDTRFSDALAIKNLLQTLSQKYPALDRDVQGKLKEQLLLLNTIATQTIGENVKEHFEQVSGSLRAYFDTGKKKE